MSGYIEGTDRGQMTLFPDQLEDWIGRTTRSAWLIFSWTRSIWQSWALVVRLRR